jgi:uncharacterized membrane protein YuzA (DUF378 family)
MKLIKSFCFLLFISVFAAAPSPIHAAISNRQEVYSQPLVAQKTIKTQKQGIVLRWLQKRLIKKNQAATEADGIKSSAKTGLLSGVLSFALFILTIIAEFIGGGSILTLLAFLVVAISAVIGAIFSMITRRSIRKSQNPEQYRKEKNKANWGLFFSLLTLLIPLAFIILLLAYWG